MDVFKFHIRLAAGKLHIGKVPKALDAKTDEAGSHILCHGLRHGEHHNINGVALDVLLQIVDGVNGNAVDGSVDNVGINIKGGVHREAAAFKGEVIQQCPAKIAYADHDEMMVIVHA